MKKKLIAEIKNYQRNGGFFLLMEVYIERQVQWDNLQKGGGSLSSKTMVFMC